MSAASVPTALPFHLAPLLQQLHAGSNKSVLRAANLHREKQISAGSSKSMLDHTLCACPSPERGMQRAAEVPSLMSQFPCNIISSRLPQSQDVGKVYVEPSQRYLSWSTLTS